MLQMATHIPVYPYILADHDIAIMAIDSHYMNFIVLLRRHEWVGVHPELKL